VAWWAVQNKRGFLELENPATVPVTTKAAAPPPVATPVPQPVPDDSVLRLSIEVTGDSWVSLEADGKSVLNEELKRGDKRAYEANDELKFRTIGNAAGLVLTLNGARVPPLGGDGDVVKNHVFNRDSLLQLRGQASTNGRASAPSTTP
jgi:hypothetical protein